MKVRQIMTVEVATAEPETTLEEIAAMMKDEDTGAVPVLDDGELVGLVTDRDIVIRCIAEGKDTAETTADDILSEDLEIVDPEADVEEASRLMSQKQIRRLPVVEDGRLVGMLSLGDIAVKADDERAAEALEEVSHGVKRSAPGRRQPGGEKSGTSEKGRQRSGVSATQRLDQERGERRLESGGRNAKQGIANRNVREEQGRQQKVVPMRKQGKVPHKRRAS